MITLITQPTLTTTVYNPIVFAVESDNTAQCSFKYICDVYVEGNYIIRLPYLPNENGHAVFNVNNILADYVKSNPKANLYGIQDTGDVIIKYNLSFGEIYDPTPNCDAIPVTYPDLLITTDFYTFNCGLNHREFLSYQRTDIPFVFEPAVRFLTDQPANIYTAFGEQAELSFFNSGVEKVRIDLIAFDGSVSSTRYINIPPVNDTASRIITVGVGIENINNTIPFASINNSINKYTVSLVDVSNQIISEIKTYTIDRRKTRYDPIRIKWLNKYGVYDSYSFSLSNSTTTSVNKKTFNKLLSGNYLAGEWTYNVSDRGRTVTTSDSKDKIVAVSNWLSDEEHEWLKGIVNSVDVYAQDTNPLYCFYSTYNAVNVVLVSHHTDIPNVNYATDVEFFVDMNDQLTNYNYNGVQKLLKYNDNNFSVISEPFGTSQINEAGFIYRKNYPLYNIPIIITTNTHEEKSSKKVRHFNLTIEFEPAFDNNNQRN